MVTRIGVIYSPKPFTFYGRHYKSWRPQNRGAADGIDELIYWRRRPWVRRRHPWTSKLIPTDRTDELIRQDDLNNTDEGILGRTKPMPTSLTRAHWRGHTDEGILTRVKPAIQYSQLIHGAVTDPAVLAVGAHLSHIMRRETLLRRALKPP